MGLFGKKKKSEETKCKECGLELHQPERLERHMKKAHGNVPCLLYTSPSPRDLSTSRMPSSA